MVDLLKMLHGDQKLDALEFFVYLGDGIFLNGCCEVSTIARIHSAWGKFSELLPLITNQVISLNSRDKVYNSCICSVMLHASECWLYQRLMSKDSNGMSVP